MCINTHVLGTILFNLKTELLHFDKCNFMFLLNKNFTIGTSRQKQHTQHRHHLLCPGGEGVVYILFLQLTLRIVEIIRCAMLVN